MLPTQLPFEIAHLITFRNFSSNYMSNLPTRVTFRNCPSNISNIMNARPITCQMYPPTITFHNCPPTYLSKLSTELLCEMSATLPNYLSNLSIQLPLKCSLNNPISCEIFTTNYLSRSSTHLPFEIA